MSSRMQQQTLKQILLEQGFDGWSVFDAAEQQSDTDSQSSWVLFNFRTSREAKVAIPNAWLYDRRRDQATGQLISVTIDNASYPVPLFKVRKLRRRTQSRAVAA